MGNSTPKAKKRRTIPAGKADILSTYNNTIVSISDPQGNVVSWASAASCGYRGSRKSTPYAAGEAAKKAASIAQENFGLKDVVVYVKGGGAGRESSIRAIHALGISISAIIDQTRTAHGGCRDRKKRRV